jgi:hypothetical protein
LALHDQADARSILAINRILEAGHEWDDDTRAPMLVILVGADNSVYERIANLVVDGCALDNA